jgi:raffinose/stachyose/melibiose transport system substrate-binding protein
VSLGNAEWRPTNEWFVSVYLNHYAGPENVYKALTGQLAWNNPLFVEAIKIFKQDFLNYWPKPDVYFSLGFVDSVPLIAMRQAAMMVVGSWAFQWVVDPTYWPSEDQWEWVPFPSLREGVDYPMVTIGVGTTLSVNKNSKHPDETARFLVWMLGYKEGIGKLLRDFPGEWLTPIEVPEEFIPAEVDPVFVKHFRTQSELIKKGAYGYTTWTFLGDRAWEWCYEGIEQVWLGQIPAEEYMKKWGEAFKKDLEAGVVPPIPERR